MNSRAWDRLRRDLDELVGARLDVATFCAEAGPQLARDVPSCAGAAESPTWYALDPCFARRLRVSPYTVQEHLRHIFAKVGVASRGELVASLFFERDE